MPNKAYLLNNEYIAPKGQRKRQNGLKTKTLVKSITASQTSLHLKSAPVIARKLALASTSGIPACSVPIGHKYLQKAGVLTPLIHKKCNGRYTTKIKNTVYLHKDSQRVNMFLRNFGDGILLSISCTSPKGHKNAQIARPNKMPNKSNTPVMYSGSLFLISPRAV